MTAALSLADIANWDAAVLLYKQALAQEVAYDVAFWRPAYRADTGGGPSIPKDIDAAMTRLMDARRAVEDQMMAVPATSVDDVIYKIGILRETWDGFEWSDKVWSPITSDLLRLSLEFKKVVAALGQVPSDRVESPVAVHTRLMRSQAWRTAVNALNAANSSPDTSDEAVTEAGDAYLVMREAHVTTLPEFREKLDLMAADDGALDAADVKNLLRDLDILGVRAMREMGK